MTRSWRPSCRAMTSRCERPQPLCQVASPASHARAMSRVQCFFAGFCCVTDDVPTLSTISMGTAISAWCKARSVQTSTKKRVRGNSSYTSGPPAPSCAPRRIPTACALNRPQERLLEPCAGIGAGRAHPKGGPEARGGRRDEGRGELARRVHGGRAGRPDQARQGARPRPPPAPPHVIRGVTRARTCSAGGAHGQEVLPRPAAVCPDKKGKNEHVRIDVGTARLVAAKYLRVKSCAELRFALAPAEEEDFEGFLSSAGSGPRVVSRTPGGTSEAAEAAEAPALPAAER